MKLCLLILVALISFRIQAVVTRDCPKVFEMEMHNLDLLDVLNELNPHDSSSVLYDGQNGPGIFKLQKRLDSLYGSISITYYLRFAGGAKCYYEGRDGSGSFFHARLEGSLKEGSKDPAVLISKSGDLVNYIEISEIQTSGLTAKSESTGLYYRGEYCNYGQCDSLEILVAEGIVNYLK